MWLFRATTTTEQSWTLYSLTYYNQGPQCTHAEDARSGSLRPAGRGGVGAWSVLWGPERVHGLGWRPSRGIMGRMGRAVPVSRGVGRELEAERKEVQIKRPLAGAGPLMRSSQGCAGRALPCAFQYSAHCCAPHESPRLPERAATKPRTAKTIFLQQNVLR